METQIAVYQGCVIFWYQGSDPLDKDLWRYYSSCTPTRRLDMAQVYKDINELHYPDPDPEPDPTPDPAPDPTPDPAPDPDPVSGSGVAILVLLYLIFMRGK